MRLFGWLSLAVIGCATEEDPIACGAGTTLVQGVCTADDAPLTASATSPAQGSQPSGNRTVELAHQTWRISCAGEDDFVPVEQLDLERLAGIDALVVRSELAGDAGHVLDPSDPGAGYFVDPDGTLFVECYDKIESWRVIAWFD